MVHLGVIINESLECKMASRILAVLFLSCIQKSMVQGGSKEPGVTVTCRAHEMKVTFEKRIFITLEARNMSLDAPACSASDSPQFISISTALNQCGTKFYETGDTIVFSNVVHKDAELVNGQITREHDFEFSFNCSYSKTKFLSLQFVPEGRLDVPGVEGFGDFNFTFDVYTSSSYSTPHSAYPVEVTLNEYIYLGYKVESSANLGVMALNCLATKSSVYYSSPQYPIIQDGCAMDTTLSHDYNSSRNWQTFALRAFRFFNDYESFYIHCELLACLEESISSRCQQGCVPSANRKKRGLEEDTAGPYIIKRGPIKIVQGKSQNENGDTGKQSAAVIGGATAAGGVGLVGVIALAAVFVKYRILRLMTNKNKVRDMYNDTTQDDDIVERDAESQNS